ncbi:hypothetical protein VAWG007_05100 [Aeromonas enteropelogenes]|nr:hypothetical protein VAWG007_05100 [Aeromonas enteropelogenes]
MPLYVGIALLLAQGIDLGRRFLGVGLTKTALTRGMSRHDRLNGFGLADGKQGNAFCIAACPPGGLGNALLYLKQVLGNLVHIS